MARNNMLGPWFWKTYAEQNWLLCYEKQEAPCPA